MPIVRIPDLFQKKWHVLCDEFSWAGWRYEGASRIRGIDADPSAWERLLSNPPRTEFLLVESVWEDFKKEYRTAELLKVINAFRKRGIPVVFWNKEDPAHFETYVRAAIASDAILTTDAGKCADYRAAGFKGPVEVLTFAAQPRIHRIYSPKDREKRVFFAGSPWLHHESRARAFDYLLAPAAETGVLDIFARKSFATGKEAWPETFQPYIRGELPYETALKTFSRYALGISLSCCPDSETMYPRRIVEIPMCGTLVVSDNNRAVKKLFPEVPVAASIEEARKILKHLLADERECRDRLQKLRSRIMREHTYTAALKKIRSVLP